jgi:hypothetical protein
VSSAAEVFERLSDQSIGELVLFADLTSAHDLTDVVREVDQGGQAVLGALGKSQHGGRGLIAPNRCYYRRKEEAAF